MLRTELSLPIIGLMDMSKTVTKVLHCFAEKSEGQWTAMCLDFSLAAQGATAEEAIKGLHSQLRSYLHDAFEGEDQEHRQELLSRRAPASMWVHYYLVKARYMLNKLTHNTHRKERVFNPKVDDLAFC